MRRQKKIKTVQLRENEEPVMTSVTQDEEETAVALETTLSELDMARLELADIQKEIEQKKHELKFVPRREIDSDEQRIVDKQISGFEKGSGLKAKIDAQKAYDSELVTGRFMNRRAPGQEARLSYIKYADDPVKWHIFEDGKIYTIRRGFVEQINEYYHTPVFVQKQGEMDPNRPTSAIHEVDTSNKKYAFVPARF